MRPTPEQQAAIDSEFEKATHWFLFMANNLPPGDFQWRFAGMIANVVGNMPDEYWREFCKMGPCDRVGCTCHETVQKHVELFTLMRRDHQEHCEVFQGPA